MHWQARVHYYWYRKIKAQCETKGKCQMGGFTRLLHSGKADDLMDEIPSYVVNPLPPDKQDHKGYVVLNRPYAFAQWTQQVKIREKYVIMSEPDHVWLKPMPNLMKVQLFQSQPDARCVDIKTRFMDHGLYRAGAQPLSHSSTLSHLKRSSCTSLRSSPDR